MPEVCEVALTAEILTKYCKNKKIEKLSFVSGRYGPNRTKPEGYKEFKRKFPYNIKKVDSKGKFMWFELEDCHGDPMYIWNTYGLTGTWLVGISDADFIRCKINLNDNLKIYYSDMRNFGTFKFSSSFSDLTKKLDSLGQDFLKSDNIDISNIKNYKKEVVVLLMDQKKIGSGIGNYLAAEILYRSKISPYRLGSSLSEKEIKRLEYMIKYTTKLAYLNNYTGYMVDFKKFKNKIKKNNYHPDIDIKDHEFDFMVYKRDKDPFGNEVKKAHIISGRTTYWVPDCQK